MTSQNAVPCLVNASQGTSVLYKDRYLFSRFVPEKSLQSLLTQMTILPKSLVLCFSPVLPFPIELIKQKLATENTTDCFILAVECDPLLHSFFLEQTGDSSFAHSTAATLIHSEVDIALLLEGHFPHKIHYAGQPLPPIASFRRVIIIEASAEVQQNKSFYASTASYAQNAVTQFWKNRMTLLRLGRLFARNTIKNIGNIPKSIPIQEGAITKPILVVGAGTSVDELIPFIREHKDNLHILAVDAALRPLLDQGIRPHAIVAVESQLANEKAFLGAALSGIPLYADLTSRPRILRITGGTISFFLSEYYRSPLLERIKKSFPTIPVFPPLGSVALSAIEIALKLRTNHHVPIFVCGLDFSFTPGKTHCKESPHPKQALFLCNRLSPIGDPSPAFRSGTYTFIGKNNIKLVSDPALRGYGELLSARYKDVRGMYDISPRGVQLSIPYCTIKQAKEMIFGGTQYSAHSIDVHNAKNPQLQEECNSNTHDALNLEQTALTFYEQEAKRLHTIRDILTGKNYDASADTENINAELIAAINDCSYLYLHFPDGHKGAQLRQDFLNRIRSEIDLFLKDIEIATNIS